jgi:hypothetical protein
MEKIIIVIYSVFILSAFHVCAQEDNVHNNKDEEVHWLDYWENLDSDCSVCENSGTQSPINISRYYKADLDNLEFSYMETPLKVINNGYTIKVEYERGSTVTIDRNEYAVDVLKIKHIIVCGHYGCGGIKAAMDNQEHGLIDNWLRNVKDVYRYHQTEIDSCPSEEDKFRRLCELNVVEQVSNICHTSIVQNAWKSDHGLAIHGWIYGIETGLLKDLNVCITKRSEISEVHRID